MVITLAINDSNRDQNRPCISFVTSVGQHQSVLSHYFVCFYFQLASCLIYPVVYYHAIYFHGLNFFQVCSLVMLTLIVQTFIGQKWIEGVEPFSGMIKSKNTLFQAVDIYNEIFMSPFQFSVMMLMRYGYRVDLISISDIELRKLLDRVHKVP